MTVSECQWERPVGGASEKWKPGESGLAIAFFTKKKAETAL